MADPVVSNNQQRDLKAVMEIHPSPGAGPAQEGQEQVVTVCPCSRRLLAEGGDGTHPTSSPCSSLLQAALALLLPRQMEKAPSKLSIRGSRLTMLVQVSCCTCSLQAAR